MGRDIGTMVKESRKRSGLTQGELGERIGISAPAICELEGGSRKSAPAPEEMVRISDAVHDVKLLHEYCDSCPIRKRIIIRKFKPLNNILSGSLASTMKVTRKLAEATEALAVMLPKMLCKGFDQDPEYLEFRNDAIIKIIDVKRGAEIMLGHMLEDRVVSSDELLVLMDAQQRLCEAKGHHIPESRA